jgi:cytochrome c peroxidase
MSIEDFIFCLNTQIVISLITLSSCTAQGLSSQNTSSPNVNAVTPTPSPNIPTLSYGIVLGALKTSIAADGTTAIIATLNDLTNKKLYTAKPVTVLFSSPCSTNKSSTLDLSITTTDGIASSAYLPKGCINSDTITARAVIEGKAVSKSILISISPVKALSNKASFGKILFFDQSLSGSGKQSCATCHSPANAYMAIDKNPVPLGGLNMISSGFRSTPSAAYTSIIPPFRYLPVTNQQGSVDNVANGKLGTPRSGLMWDGRASNVSIQARGPFTGPHEMANKNNAEVQTRLLTKVYLAQYKTLYGNVTSSSNADTTVANLADAIAAYETEEASFQPLNSKFDLVQKGLAKLTAQEINGQTIFNSSTKAACQGCHDSTGKSIDGPQLFSDFSYRSIAVPRNWKIPYNNDALVSLALKNLGLSANLNGSTLGTPNHLYYDLGFCGPFRTDTPLSDPANAPLCGTFRVAPLRNIALKGSYFHNGVFNSLEQVINFYINRDQKPETIYLDAKGARDLQYNDLPDRYFANVTKDRAPFQALKTGGVRLTPSETQDLIAFLCTLTDGFDPAQPDAYRLPLQCRNAIRP